jgi:hypothetical protein
MPRSIADRRVIHIHPLAPPKPALGAPCNGCGWCCAAEPCPLGVVVSRRRHGACAALAWDDADGRYGCGVLQQPRRHLSLFRLLPQRWAQRVVARWIAAGRGCDADFEREDPPTQG